MKNLILTTILILAGLIPVSAQTLDETLLKVQRLHTTLVQNESKISSTNMSQINGFLNQAQALAQSSSDSGSDYTACRQAGYSHESCAGQSSSYTECRKSGYSHESCYGQGYGYTSCRKAGYSHESCKGQTVLN